MTQLLTRFALTVAAFLLVGGALVWLVWQQGPSEAELKSEADDLHRVISELESELREQPVEKWWPYIQDREEYDNYWIEFDNISDLDRAMAAVVRTGDVEVSDDADGYPMAQTLVRETDQVVSISLVMGDTFSEFLSENAAAIFGLIAALGIPALFAWMVMRPLNRTMNTLETAARGYASGNFASRIPSSAAPVAEELGESFNSMAGRIETLVARNDSILDDQREMLRAVAHEFRGPLARIRFALDMTEDADGYVAPELNTEMGGALDELDLLVGEVLSYARLQPGSPMLNVDAVSFDQVVTDAVEQARIGNEGTIFEVKPGPGSNHSVDADAYFLHRAVLNLLNNGARHSDSTVQIEWYTDPTNCYVVVEDDGEGIPAGWKPRIFDPFVRVDPSRSRNSGGVGLGLAIVKRILEKHSGTARVGDSDELGGAQFMLCWPLRSRTTDSNADV